MPRKTREKIPNDLAGRRGWENFLLCRNGPRSIDLPHVRPTLSEDTIKIVLKAHPGKVVETEFGIEANGDASYEFDIELNRRRLRR